MAYTKYSLTPSSNTAAPPDGAPEGMLPSAVNDTMRDMMAQIRDCGDGIRGGTYTMTAPVITGGSINNTTVGATTRSTGAFTTLASNGATTFTAGTASTSTTTGTAVITGGLGVSGRINAANFDGIIGANTAAAVSSTDLAYTGTLTGGTGVVNLGSGQFYKDASGNVGIGTASPASKLDVSSSGATIASISTTGVSPGVALKLIGATATYKNWLIGSSYAVTAGALEFIPSTTVGGSTFTTPAMTINSSGNLLVGTTSASALTGPLTLSSNTGTTNWLCAPWSGNAAQFYIAANASFGVYLASTSATSWTGVSDERLKENLIPITDAINKVSSLRSVTGNYIADKEKNSKSFLIAQDVQKVLPEAVDATNPDKLGVQYTDVIPLLVAAIKEQQTLIESLTTRLTVLETK